MALEFSLDLQSEPVTLTKDGEKESYVLKEMTGQQRDQYLTSLSKRVSTGKDGKATVSNFEGLQAELLTRCLFVVSTNEPAAREVIQSFPASVQSKLFEAAQSLNGLDKEEDVEKKS